MSKLSKRKKMFLEKVDARKAYSLEEGVALLKETSNVKFDPTVEIHVRLGIDPKKSDQVVRSSTVLPNGTGKVVRVAVFTEGADADKAKAAGADIVGSKDLAEDIKKGEINFDILIATPNSMGEMGKLGQILGPKGLMPNPKVGTVTQDVEKAVKNAKSGQVQYRVDKAGIVHVPLGKLSFETSAIIENLNSLVADLKRAKPSSSKGVFFKKISLSSTMGPGITIDKSTVSAV